MRKSIGLLIMFGLLASCEKGSKKLEHSALEDKETPKTQMTIQSETQQQLEKERLMAAHQSLIQILEPSALGTENLADYYNFKQITAEGSISSLELDEALKQYLELMNNPNTTAKPIFEVRDRDQVLLPLNDGQVAVCLLLNKSTLIIDDMQFLDNSKTDKLGANRMRFSDQFIGKNITFNSKNFGLKPWDKPSFEGDVQIDGISGATDICQAAIDLLNEQLPFYQPYLQLN